jgi:hypothetical protein
MSGQESPTPGIGGGARAAGHKSVDDSRARHTPL